MKKSVVVDEERTIRQMVAFIQAEAREKEIEIDQQAQEEQDIEKQRLVDLGKRELLADFESKIRDLEIEKRVVRSKCMRDCNFGIEKEKAEVLSTIRDLLFDRCRDIRKDTAFYRKNLLAFIREAVDSVRHDAEVICLSEEVPLVEDLIKETNDRLEEENVYNDGSTRHIRLSLCTTENLPEEKLGGVVLRALNGKITCDNSTFHRALICIEDHLPMLRKMLFE